jgi:Domain of unknown function (DUF4272)
MLAEMLVNVYCTHRRPTLPGFPHRLNARRDRSDPALAPHLDGFMGFVMQQGARPMNQMRYHVLRHLARVQHQLSFEFDVAHVNAFAEWARAANGIVFLTDGSVRAPDGAILVDPATGDPEPGAELPYPDDALQRKTATERALAVRGIAVPRSLPPVVAEVEVEVRPASEVADRCRALFACAVRAESITAGQTLATSDIGVRVPGALEAMSPSERRFFEARSPDRQAVLNHVWRYEALAALLWAVHAQPALPFPERLCDVPKIAKTMLDAGSLPNARARDAREVLDTLDLHYRIHWATTEARLKNFAPPAGVDPGVVVERHRALNWLTRWADADWDDVDTPT